MKSAPPARAVRVLVSDNEFLLDNGGTVDYSDSFELHLASPDLRAAEEWVRAGLEGAPAALRSTIRLAQRFVLGLRLAPASSPDHILGWTIDASEPDVVRLSAASRFMRARLVGRRIDPMTARVTTMLFYDHPRIARPLWSIVGPVHRRVARYLLERAAKTPG